ncbi:MAG: AmmeMemoRadiSam system protein A [Candidatus Saganbacteria bacterium]|nr:AmmeMemoRadiSam system protein A [Candidatus Saganbacteria bacterium]
MLHPLVVLAKNAIASYVKEKKIIDVPDTLIPEMKGRAGTFVSVHTLNGALRGCIGTFAPTRENIAREIIYNAISAATQDPRFPPIEADELDGLDISVDVLSEAVPVGSIKELDAKKYGVIVKAGNRKGLLLPDLDGVDTPEHQISICRRKGGIGEREPAELFKFTVKRYH